MYAYNLRVYVVLHTFRARDGGTALVRGLLYRAVLSDGFRERAHPQVAHQHPVVTRAVQTRLVGHNSIALLVVLVVVVAAVRVCVINRIDKKFEYTNTQNQYVVK